MKRYELIRKQLRWFEIPLYHWTYRQLRALVLRPDFELLDVGGRKSPYTIGIKARITISDLLRETSIQNSLKLGLNESMRDFLLSNRSNVTGIVYDDLASSKLPDNSYDGIVSVEVIEHVDKDEDFVRNAARIVKPGGFILLTTPNGDWVENNNPDHKRHYRKNELENLLARHFTVDWVRFKFRGKRLRRWGLQPWSLRRPLNTAKSMIGNLLTQIWSMSNSDDNISSKGNYHLVALAHKPQSKAT